MAAKKWTAFHAAEEEIRRNPRGLRLFYDRNSKRIEELAGAARRAGVPADRVSEQKLAERIGDTPDRRIRGFVLVREETPRGGAAGGKRRFGSIREYLDGPGDGEGGEDRLILALDGITDPQNLGALLRSADIFQADLVVIPERRAAGITETVDRVSSGASGWVPLCQAKNLGRSLGELQEAGYWVYGADMEGGRADQTRLTGRSVIVLGREGKGLSRLIREKSDALISLPGGGHIDSLNVSVAGGILLYEARRQAGFPYRGNLKKPGR